MGHIKKACRKKLDSGVVLTEATRQGKQQTRKAVVGRTVKTVEPSDTSSVEEYLLHQLTENLGYNPIELNVDVQGETISMESCCIPDIRKNLQPVFLRCFPEEIDC